MLTWAIDAFPIGKILCESWDYSALQLNSLTSVSISRACHLGFITLEEDQDCWTALPSDEFRWSDGSRVSGLDLMTGFKRLFRSNPLVMRALFSSVDRIEANAGLLRIHLRTTDKTFHEVLELPNLAPFRDGVASCGPGVLQWREENTWNFSPNPFWKGRTEAIQVLKIQEPETNLALFQSGELDCTSDTAFPFGRATELGALRADTGLEFMLKVRPGIPYAAEIRASIAGVRARIEREILGGEEPGECRGLNQTGQPALRLVYDPYYPNRQICTSLAGALSSAGFNVHCLEDDYYRPSVPYDLRLLIARGPHTRVSVRERVSGLTGGRIPLFKFPSLRLDRFPEMNLFTKLLEVGA